MTLAPHHRLYACFFLFAFTLGGLLSRLPDIQRALGASESQLGLTIIGMSIGSLLALTLSGPLINRLGPRLTAYVTVIGIAVILAIVPWTTSPPVAFGVLFCAGLLVGALEINLNVETDRREALLGKRIMNRAHGFWSFGFFVTALVGAAIRESGISMQMHMILIVVVVAVAGYWVISGIEPAPARLDSHTGEAPRVALPTMGLLGLCIIGFSPMLVEGTGVDWSIIYMRDVFAPGAFVEGMSLTLFALFMALMRLFIDPVVERFGPRTVATALLLVSAAGLATVGLAPNPWVALVGFVLLGAGCSAVYPIAVSEAARRTDRPSATNVAALAQTTFVVFFLAPPLLGFVAEHLGIRNAYLICLPMVVLSLAFVSSMSTRPPRPAAGGTPPAPTPSSVHG